MARKQSIDIPGSLKDLFPDSFLEEVARQSGFFRRRRKLNVVAFFWTLVLGFGGGRQRTISSLRRSYERVTGATFVPSSFYDRFNKALVRFLKTALTHALETFQLAWDASEDLAAAFRDVVIADATVMQLKDGLRKKFPGCRPKSAPAMAKLHAILSVKGKGKSTVLLSSERVSELKKFSVGPWVKGCLLLFDLGYFRYQLFSCIRRNGGFFVTRLKRQVNPTIVQLHRRVRGNAVSIQGRKLQDVLRRLKREVLDCEVEAEFPRRVYAGRRRTARERYRFVAIRDPHSSDYHTYVTNVPPEVLSAESIAAAYRARWAIELVFAELKSGYRMAHINTEKKEIAEALTYSALLSLMASRKLIRAFGRTRKTERMTTGRWWTVFAMLASDFLQLVTSKRPDPGISRKLVRTILHELIDPHRDRCPLLPDSLRDYRVYARV